ncbi:prephenate dehydrogenase [Sphaerisporangium siamense]|uniref:Prephenate dehydrogenase n=1 Tax=Sphaerisporangium siamense TaxID=795645 RepID=A0A7W7GBG5_9ACTN|nr:prephenate dehydrogenase [Sphaerisporangium siamense]MBB4702414.1 prephenate dehydrogenase [Sphaerisporangium siamense]GII88951.1 prephenate dehydrogenase [Sphaerisporangium siamense]
MHPATLRRVTIMGSGLIGTSIGLALRRSGVLVALSDRDEDVVAKAEMMGAGVALTPGDPPADVVLIATPPSIVAKVLRDAQSRGLGAAYTDVASTKAGIVAEAERAGCDLSTYVPGHPMGGRELSGPFAARADLFAGRPWLLCPHPTTPPGPLALVAELATACGAAPEVIEARAHDQIVATVSHVPHLVSAALAARFCAADDTTLSLVGKGLQDTTRIATGDPGLWSDILAQNADAVAAVLDEVVGDLTEAVRALRGLEHGGHGRLSELLTRGNRGREHIVRGHRAASRV